MADLDYANLKNAVEELPPDSAISTLMEKPYPRNGFSTVDKPPGIKKITYTHDAMIDEMIKDPKISQAQLARHFGYTQGWISQIINSDAFRERLAERKDAVVDPAIRLSVEERIRGMVDQATQVIMRKLEEAPNASVAIKALTAGSQALGMGQRTFGVVQQNNYIALVPPTSRSGSEWTQLYRPEVIDGDKLKRLNAGADGSAERRDVSLGAEGEEEEAAGGT